MDRVEALADRVVSDIEDCFEFIDQLGEGATSAVYLGALKASAEAPEVAIKAFDRGRLEDEEAFATAAAEVRTIRSIQQHPHIVQLREVVCDDSSLCVVQEALGGGELFLHLQNEGALSEEHALRVFAQIALAVEHMHAHKIAHRDLKAENVVFLDEAMEHVKLIDFGSAAAITPDGMRGLVATAHYCAPEVARAAGYAASADANGDDAPYTQACDLWSLGCLLYLMLSRRLPFAADKAAEEEEDDEAVLRRVAAAHFEFQPAAAWRTVSPEAQDLIRALLRADPQERLGLSALKAHPWCASAFLELSAAAQPMQAADNDASPAASAAAPAPAAAIAAAPPPAPAAAGGPVPAAAEATLKAASADGAPPWRAYLRVHLARLEVEMGAAADVAMSARPQQPLSRLAEELEARACGGGGEPTGGGADGATGEPEVWDEEAARREMESALDAAVHALLAECPDEPLAWIAAHVRRMACVS